MMHAYLRSIGFSKINKEDLSHIMKKAYEQPDGIEMAIDSEGNELSEIRLEIAEGIGLAMRGCFDDESDKFIADYYFPYCKSTSVSCETEVQVIKESDRDCYQGVCEQDGIQMDLIFHLQNMLPIMQTGFSDVDSNVEGRVAFSGLAKEGTIIMPMFRSKSQEVRDKHRQGERTKLLTAARDGDTDAYEKLTLDDMDTYAMISKRIHGSDLYSIVYSSFMPSGIENDKYKVLGDILSVREAQNPITNECMYILAINANGMILDICINKADLLGVPEVGRRFKGLIWLQGQLNISNC